jgi:hypothetical protein
MVRPYTKNKLLKDGKKKPMRNQQTRRPRIT